jgi:hypothetical protein
MESLIKQIKTLQEPSKRKYSDEQIDNMEKRLSDMEAFISMVLEYQPSKIKNPGRKTRKYFKVF